MAKGIKNFHKDLKMKPTTKITSTLTALAVVLTILLSACGSAATPNPTTDPSVFYTQAAATIALGLTQTVQAMPSATQPPATATPEPSATPAEATATVNPADTLAPTPPPTAPAPVSTASGPTLAPVNPATARGCFNATFVSDVTIQYAPTFNPGETFTKTWRVKNTGTCDWPRGVKIVFASGDRFGADTTNLDQKVPVGSTTDISLKMKAPNLAGVVTSNWQLATDLGKAFGPVLSVAITLPGSSTNTGAGCLNSELVSDVTVPTGTQLQPNETFKKTWLIKNTGSCAWTREFKITYVGGDLLGSDTTSIRQKVGAGESAEISLEMTAPNSTGTISTAWQMASDDGRLFGQLFAFSIVVK
jgi:hypothetical protein